MQWTSKLCPFHISKKYLLGTDTLFDSYIYFYLSQIYHVYTTV